MATKKQPEGTQKRVLDDLHPILMKHNVRPSVQVRFAAEDAQQQDCWTWDGSEWVRC